MNIYKEFLQNFLHLNIVSFRHIPNIQLYLSKIHWSASVRYFQNHCYTFEENPAAIGYSFLSCGYCSVLFEGFRWVFGYRFCIHHCRFCQVYRFYWRCSLEVQYWTYVCYADFQEEYFLIVGYSEWAGVYVPDSIFDGEHLELHLKSFR